jgi:hypothetical protein
MHRAFADADLEKELAGSSEAKAVSAHEKEPAIQPSAQAYFLCFLARFFGIRSRCSSIAVQRVFSTFILA